MSWTALQLGSNSRSQFRSTVSGSDPLTMEKSLSSSPHSTVTNGSDLGLGATSLPGFGTIFPELFRPLSCRDWAHRTARGVGRLVRDAAACSSSLGCRMTIVGDSNYRPHLTSHPSKRLSRNGILCPFFHQALVEAAQFLSTSYISVW